MLTSASDAGRSWQLLGVFPVHPLSPSVWLPDRMACSPCMCLEHGYHRTPGWFLHSKEARIAPLRIAGSIHWSLHPERSCAGPGSLGLSLVSRGRAWTLAAKADRFSDTHHRTSQCSNNVITFSLTLRVCRTSENMLTLGPRSFLGMSNTMFIFSSVFGIMMMCSNSGECVKESGFFLILR